MGSMRKTIVLPFCCLCSLLAFPEDPEPAKIVIEDFHEFKGWTPGNQVNDKTDYFLQKEKGKSFLRAHFMTGTKGQPVHKTFNWDSKKYPFLNWKWRVNKFPEGAKILDSDKSDAAAQLYVFWNNSGPRLCPQVFLVSE